jgi:hypothetical protein
MRSTPWVGFLCVAAKLAGCASACEGERRIQQTGGFGVGPSGDYKTVGEALASAAAGGVITIAAGTYAEALEISQDVTLTAEAGAEVILCPEGGVGIHATSGASVLIQGLTIDCATYAGLWCQGAICTLEAVEVRNTKPRQEEAGPAGGHGILVDQGGVLHGKALRIASNAGDGLHAEGAGTVEIGPPAGAFLASPNQAGFQPTGAQIDANGGSGILVSSPAAAPALVLSMVEVTAHGAGSGISLAGATAVVSRTRVTTNRYGGVWSTQTAGALTLSDSLLDQNEAVGLAIVDGTAIATSVGFSGTQPAEIECGAAYGLVAAGTAKVELEGASFGGNSQADVLKTSAQAVVSGLGEEAIRVEVPGSTCPCWFGAPGGDPISGDTCDDGDPCTLEDACVSRECVGTALDCNDGNPCTDDSCDPTNGCEYANKVLLCDDNDPCTLFDACGDGDCVGTADDCDDDNLCTDDSCEPTSGCQHAYNDHSCDDGNACTLDDACGAGLCVGATQYCDDQNPATLDTCTPADAAEPVCEHCTRHAFQLDEATVLTDLVEMPPATGEGVGDLLVVGHGVAEGGSTVGVVARIRAGEGAPWLYTVPGARLEAVARNGDAYFAVGSRGDDALAITIEPGVDSHCEVVTEKAALYDVAPWITGAWMAVGSTGKGDAEAPWFGSFGVTTTGCALLSDDAPQDAKGRVNAIVPRGNGHVVAGSVVGMRGAGRDVVFFGDTADGEEWGGFLGGSGDDEALDLAVLGDGGLILAGYQTVEGKRRPWLWRVRPDHTLAWSRGLGVEAGVGQLETIALGPGADPSWFWTAGEVAKDGLSKPWVARWDADGNFHPTQQGPGTTTLGGYRAMVRDAMGYAAVGDNGSGGGVDRRDPYGRLVCDGCATDPCFEGALPSPCVSLQCDDGTCTSTTPGGPTCGPSQAGCIIQGICKNGSCEAPSRLVDGQLVPDLPDQAGWRSLVELSTGELAALADASPVAVYRWQQGQPAVPDDPGLEPGAVPVALAATDDGGYVVLARVPDATGSKVALVRVLEGGQKAWVFLAPADPIDPTFTPLDDDQYLIVASVQGLMRRIVVRDDGTQEKSTEPPPDPGSEPKYRPVALAPGPDDDSLFAFQDVDNRLVAGVASKAVGTYHEVDGPPLLIRPWEDRIAVVTAGELFVVEQDLYPRWRVVLPLGITQIAAVGDGFAAASPTSVEVYEWRGGLQWDAPWQAKEQEILAAMAGLRDGGMAWLTTPGPKLYRSDRWGNLDCASTGDCLEAALPDHEACTRPSCADGVVGQLPDPGQMGQDCGPVAGDSCRTLGRCDGAGDCQAASPFFYVPLAEVAPASARALALKSGGYAVLTPAKLTLLSAAGSLTAETSLAAPATALVEQGDGRIAVLTNETGSDQKTIWAQIQVLDWLGEPTQEKPSVYGLKGLALASLPGRGNYLLAGENTKGQAAMGWIKDGKEIGPVTFPIVPIDAPSAVTALLVVDQARALAAAVQEDASQKNRIRVIPITLQDGPVIGAAGLLDNVVVQGPVHLVQAGPDGYAAAAVTPEGALRVVVVTGNGQLSVAKTLIDSNSLGGLASLPSADIKDKASFMAGGGYQSKPWLAGIRYQADFVPTQIQADKLPYGDWEVLALAAATLPEASPGLLVVGGIPGHDVFAARIGLEGADCALGTCKTGTCIDADPCTQGDTCQVGVCRGYLAPCADGCSSQLGGACSDRGLVRVEPPFIGAALTGAKANAVLELSPPVGATESHLLVAGCVTNQSDQPGSFLAKVGQGDTTVTGTVYQAGVCLTALDATPSQDRALGVGGPSGSNNAYEITDLGTLAGGPRSIADPGGNQLHLSDLAWRKAEADGWVIAGWTESVDGQRGWLGLTNAPPALVEGSEPFESAFLDSRYNAVVALAGGGVAATGRAGGDILVAWQDGSSTEAGRELTYGVRDKDEGLDLVELPGGGLVVAGKASHQDDDRAVLLRIDGDGLVRWARVSDTPGTGWRGLALEGGTSGVFWVAGLDTGGGTLARYDPHGFRHATFAAGGPSGLEALIRDAGGLSGVGADSDPNFGLVSRIDLFGNLTGGSCQACEYDAQPCTRDSCGPAAACATEAVPGGTACAPAEPQPCDGPAVCDAVGTCHPVGKLIDGVSIAELGAPASDPVIGLVELTTGDLAALRQDGGVVRLRGSQVLEAKTAADPTETAMGIAALHDGGYAVGVAKPNASQWRVQRYGASGTPEAATPWNATPGDQVPSPPSQLILRPRRDGRLAVLTRSLAGAWGLSHLENASLKQLGTAYTEGPVLAVDALSRADGSLVVAVEKASGPHELLSFLEGQDTPSARWSYPAVSGALRGIAETTEGMVLVTADWRLLIDASGYPVRPLLATTPAQTQVGGLGPLLVLASGTEQRVSALDSFGATVWEWQVPGSSGTPLAVLRADGTEGLAWLSGDGDSWHLVRSDRWGWSNCADSGGCIEQSFDSCLSVHHPCNTSRCRPGSDGTVECTPGSVRFSAPCESDQAACTLSSCSDQGCMPPDGMVLFDALPAQIAPGSGGTVGCDDGRCLAGTRLGETVVVWDDGASYHLTWLDPAGNHQGTAELVQKSFGNAVRALAEGPDGRFQVLRDTQSEGGLPIVDLVVVNGPENVELPVKVSDPGVVAAGLVPHPAGHGTIWVGRKIPMEPLPQKQLTFGSVSPALVPSQPAYADPFPGKIYMPTAIAANGGSILVVVVTMEGVYVVPLTVEPLTAQSAILVPGWKPTFTDPVLPAIASVDGTDGFIVAAWDGSSTRFSRLNANGMPEYQWSEDTGVKIRALAPRPGGGVVSVGDASGAPWWMVHNQEGVRAMPPFAYGGAPFVNVAPFMGPQGLEGFISLRHASGGGYTLRRSDAWGQAECPDQGKCLGTTGYSASTTCLPLWCDGTTGEATQLVTDGEVCGKGQKCAGGICTSPQ